MIKLFFLCLSLFLLAPAHATEFCERGRHEIQQLLTQAHSRIALRNGGGLFNAGVCWWHSRLQRSSLFLVQFAPQEPRPGGQEAARILAALKDMRQVVTIPGYTDFESFTRDHHPSVQKLLNGWQKSDGFFQFSWVRGISGKSSLPPQKMRRQMDRIFRAYLASPVPIWLMAQIRGITAHSVLVKRMQKIPQGYRLWLVDSNRPQQTIQIDYQEGDASLRTTAGNYNFVPYLGFQQDFKKMAQALKSYCGKGSALVHDMLTVPAGDVELTSAL
jgi:hypothetical protein